MNTTKEISLVVFFCRWSLSKASLREGAGDYAELRKQLHRSSRSESAVEGERVTIELVQIQSYAGSFHHFVVPLPPGGRLLRAVLLLIAGSGFCPIVHGRPRAMLAPATRGAFFASCV